MASRCLNKIMLIGNLTRDPELRYTPNGVSVCSFGLATNRQWTTQDGQRKDDAQFHRIVAWSQLAEICSQLLSKGARVYVEGRIQYREWTGADEVKRQTAEVVIEDMILLSSRQGEVSDQPEAEKGPDLGEEDFPPVDEPESETEAVEKEKDQGAAQATDPAQDDQDDQGSEEEGEEDKDIPF